MTGSREGSDQTTQLPFSWQDALIGFCVGAGFLGLYVRTLAPDILYADSAEFQTLAYTLGLSHPSGYAIYLLIAKIFTLLPLRTIAWRVNFLSAFLAAFTLIGIYLLIRQLTRSRAGAVLGAVILGIGQTFWSQAVIAEVYSAASATMVAILLLLYDWQNNPARRGSILFLASLLVGLSVHITVVVIVPAMAILAFWTLAELRFSWQQWARTISWAITGAVTGLGLFLLATLLLELHDPPTSYIRVTLLPAFSAWGITAEQIDTPLERMLATIFGVQWQRSLFSGERRFMLSELKHYLQWALKVDLAYGSIFLALAGTISLWIKRRRWVGFLLLYGATLLYLIINYEGPGKFVFYLATYVLIAIVAGSGAGIMLDRLGNFLSPRPAWLSRLVYPLIALLFLLISMMPFWETRWQALRFGAVTFVEGEDTYPVHNLQEPRQVAEQRLRNVEDDAVLLLDWKTLYATYYVANIEQDRTGIRIIEDIINRDDGRLADSLIQVITNELQEGHPVYSDRPYSYLEERFHFEPVPGTDLVRLSLH